MNRRLPRADIDQRDAEIITAFLDDHAKVEDLQASFEMSDSAVRSVLRKKLPRIADDLPPTTSPVTYKFQAELAREIPREHLLKALQAVRLENGSSLESLILNEAGVESDVWRFFWDYAISQNSNYSISDVILIQPDASRGVITRLRTYANGWGEHHISLINFTLGVKRA